MSRMRIYPRLPSCFTTTGQTSSLSHHSSLSAPVTLPTRQSFQPVATTFPSTTRSINTYHHHHHHQLQPEHIPTCNSTRQTRTLATAVRSSRLSSKYPNHTNVRSITMSDKLIPRTPSDVMVIRDITPNVVTLSVPFARFGMIRVGGRATIGTQSRLFHFTIPK